MELILLALVPVTLVGMGLCLRGPWARGRLWVGRRRAPRPAALRLVAVHLTADGNALDVRYLVRRPGVLPSPAEVSVVGGVGGRSEATMSVPKIGRLASRTARRGQQGFVLLANTSRLGRHDNVNVTLGTQRWQTQVR